MAYCTFEDINLITNITDSDIISTDITDIILDSTKELNGLINVRVEREEVGYIDSTRTNKRDGSNKTYYVKNWKERYIADMDDDGIVDENDIKVYVVDSTGTESEAIVSSISTDNKSFTLATAYDSSYRLYVTYEWCYRNPATPDPLIALACKYLTAAYCYAKINIGRSPQVKFGNTRIYRHMESFNHYYERFLDVVNTINNQMSSYTEVEGTL